MNEDEAFIRAIVDNPGDDTPRLVYADWLDDHDDPRGTYLRAERDAVAAGNITRLKELAVGLDPMWVARVSRPPVGVCCDGFSLGERGPEVSSDDLDRFQTRFGMALPTAYRAFLLNYNGGVAEFHGGCVFCSLAKTMDHDPRNSLEYEYAVTKESLYHELPRGDSEYRIRLRNSMIIGRAPGHPAWAILGLGERSVGWVRTVDQCLVLGDRPFEPMRFNSLPEYLFFLTPSENRVKGLLP